MTSAATPLSRRSVQGKLPADEPRHRRVTERRRYELRVNPRAAGDDDVDVGNAVGDADVRGITGFSEPARAPVMQAGDGTRSATAVQYQIRVNSHKDRALAFS